MKNQKINVAKYTEFTELVDIKRLNFIADSIQEHCNPGARILDVGCGNGNIARGIGSLGYEVVGIDFSEDAIRYAKSKNTLPNVSFRVCSAEEVAATEHFDAVICSEVLEHLHKPELLVKTLSKILKPGAVLIATVPNGIGPRELLVTRPVQKMSKSWMGKVIDNSKKALGYSNSTVQSMSGDLTHVQFFTKSAICNLIKSEGFDILEFGHSNFVEKVFPYSLLTRKIKTLSEIDNTVIDYLPSVMASGFNTVWRKK
jgi:2-polyprenyl-3-methyl-5-hydroxy-6-metoxy-1,4-benzoquinol methylase